MAVASATNVYLPGVELLLTPEEGRALTEHLGAVPADDTGPLATIHEALALALHGR